MFSISSLVFIVLAHGQVFQIEMNQVIAHIFRRMTKYSCWGRDKPKCTERKKDKEMIKEFVKEK